MPHRKQKKNKLHKQDFWMECF